MSRPLWPMDVPRFREEAERIGILNGTLCQRCRKPLCSKAKDRPAWCEDCRREFKQRMDDPLKRF